MILKKLKLVNFRNHKSAQFKLSPTTVIIGKNTAGKTNILEAIYVLSAGRSFRAERDLDTIAEGSDFARIEAEIETDQEKIDLKVIFSTQKGYLSKKFLVNGVARRQHDFASNFVSVLFTPKDVEIMTDSPGVRRRHIDAILYQADRNYRKALSSYEKALRHRNKMLHDLREGKKQYVTSDFDYFNNILIEQGGILTSKREEFVEFVNNAKKDIFRFELFYDKSIMSLERLFKYHFEEQAAGVTLVGPQRDDFGFFFPADVSPSMSLRGDRSNIISRQSFSKLISEFGSRGEERLAILQLKILEVNYLQQATNQIPMLLLDDIFSELDDANIFKVFELLPNQQTVLTTTHREFVPKKIMNREDVEIIEL